MSYNVKNYTEQGGEKTVIGGTLEVKSGANVVGLTEVANLPKLDNIAQATDEEDVVTQFNVLLDELIDKGLMEEGD